MNEHAVATFDPGDEEYNTITFPNHEVIIPLQEDLDCDPLQDDEIRLASLCGGYEQILLASDENALANHDEALIYYHFKDVPPGYYSISVRIGEQWVEISRDLIVTARGVFFGGKRLSKEPPKIDFTSRRASVLSEPKAPPPPVRILPRYIDLNEAYMDEQ